MKNAYVYLIKSKSEKLYIGSTDNLDRRIKEHNWKKNISTKSESGWQVVYFEKYKNILEARKSELKIKKSRFQRDIFYERAGVVRN